MIIDYIYILKQNKMAIYGDQKHNENMEYVSKQSYTLYAMIKIEIESNLPFEDAIDEFQSNCMYDFPSTEKCNVIEMRWEDTTL